MKRFVSTAPLVSAASFVSIGIQISSQVDGTEKLGNTHIVINDNGSIAATYRKLHLFDVDIKVCDNANTANPYITHVQNSFASTAAQASQRCTARMATTYHTHY
jgi:predicted amidohydrolase